MFHFDARINTMLPQQFVLIDYFFISFSPGGGVRSGVNSGPLMGEDWMDETCFSNTFLISAKWHSLRHGSSNSSAGCCFSWLVGPLRFTLVQLVETWRGTFSIQAELAIGKFRLPRLSLDANCLKHHLTWNGSYRVLHELVTIFT